MVWLEHERKNWEWREAFDLSHSEAKVFGDVWSQSFDPTKVWIL